MTNREQAKMTGYSGIDQFLILNSTVYATKTAFLAGKTIFDNAYTDSKTKASKTGTDNTGFSKNKLVAKKAMSSKCAILSGFAKVRFEMLGKFDLADQLHIAETDYTSTSDGEAFSLAKAAYELMNNNIADLTPDYVVAADLTALLTLITTFNSTQGSSDSAHQAEPQDTSAFKASLVTTDTAIDNLLILGRFAIGTADEPFYDQLKLVCQVPTVNIHHTTVNITVQDKDTNKAIANASGSLSNSDKTGTSDLNGFMQIDQVRSGQKIILTVKASSYKDVVMQIGITRGKDNNFTISMEKV